MRPPQRRIIGDAIGAAFNRRLARTGGVAPLKAMRAACTSLLPHLPIGHAADLAETASAMVTATCRHLAPEDDAAAAKAAGGSDALATAAAEAREKSLRAAIHLGGALAAREIQPAAEIAPADAPAASRLGGALEGTLGVIAPLATARSVLDSTKARHRMNEYELCPCDHDLRYARPRRRARTSACARV